jgi:hypothetical protein
MIIAVPVTCRSAALPNAKIVSNENDLKKFLTETRSTLFSLATDVIAFGGLIHLTQTKVRLSKAFKINNRRSRLAA